MPTDFTHSALDGNRLVPTPAMVNYTLECKHLFESLLEVLLAVYLRLSLLVM